LGCRPEDGDESYSAQALPDALTMRAMPLLGVIRV
jgi:hypothetical protein